MAPKESGYPANAFRHTYSQWWADRASFVVGFPKPEYLSPLLAPSVVFFSPREFMFSEIYGVLLNYIVPLHSVKTCGLSDEMMPERFISSQNSPTYAEVSEEEALHFLMLVSYLWSLSEEAGF